MKRIEGLVLMAGLLVGCGESEGEFDRRVNDYDGFSAEASFKDGVKTARVNGEDGEFVQMIRRPSGDGTITKNILRQRGLKKYDSFSAMDGVYRDVRSEGYDSSEAADLAGK